MGSHKDDSVNNVCFMGKERKRQRGGGEERKQH